MVKFKFLAQLPVDHFAYAVVSTLIFFLSDLLYWLIMGLIVSSLSLYNLAADSFYWSLSNSKFPQVSKTLLSILAELNNTIVWMVFISPLISKSSSTCIKPLVTVQSVSITIGINVSIVFFSSLAIPASFSR